MSELVTRKALAGEVPAIQAIAREVILTGYRGFLGDEAVTAFVASGQSDRELVEHRDDLHVLTDGQRLLGFAVCFDDFVHLMMIRPDAQGRGHGGRLLKDCEALMRGRGHGRGRLETFAANGRAVRFYARNGWSEVRRDGEGSGAFARVWFEKSL